MCQPLPISMRDAVAGRSMTHVRETEIEAGIPVALPFDVVARQARNLFNRTAKTSRADHGTVRTSQASRAHLIPVTVSQILSQNVACCFGIECANLLVDGLLPFSFCLSEVFLRGGLRGEFVQDRLPAVAA